MGFAWSAAPASGTAPVRPVELEPSPVLAGDQIHLWRTVLPVAASDRARFYDWMSADERQRAERFHFAPDRDRFVSARGVLRAILASYLGVAPEEIEFQYTDKGKPELKTAAVERTLNFNLSHSHDLAIYAFGMNRNIGVDVEKVRDGFPVEDVARLTFSPGEIRSLMALPAAIRTAAFFACWTRKEAYVKALGEGLGTPLDSFEVAVDPRAPARLLRGNDPSWQIAAFTADPGYQAALVHDGGPARLRLLDGDLTHRMFSPETMHARRPARQGAQ